MTGQQGWNLASAVLVLAATSTGSLAQGATADRVFGQLKPGQTVVEINQDDTLLDNGWSPVVSPAAQPSRAPAQTTAAPTTTGPVPESLAAPEGATSPNVAPLGGLNILEELAQRQSEADAASARVAARLAAQREREALENPTANAGPAGPSGLELDLPPQERLTIGGTASTPRADTGTTTGDTASAPSTNFVRDWFEAQNSTVQTLMALGFVILLIYSLAWVYRKMAMNKGGVAGVNSGKAPAGLLEVLGRYPLGGKQSLVLLKFDRRVLLLAQSPSGKGGVEMKTLCELDQPEDVASVLMKVRDADGDSLNKAFRSAMSKAELGAAATERMIEPKSAPASPARPSKPSRPARPVAHSQVEPKADVLPGLRDPFNGFGGDFVRPTRNVNLNPEGDRSELWGTPSKSTNGAAHDPVASLKQRLEAMRRGERVK